MRISKFDIERYGAFENRDLTFSEAHGLTVVFGPNEAGKSTLLSAVGDFLFGIPQQSPHGSRFGYDLMRIGSTMQLADGTSLSLRRRKGRGVTLADESGKGVEETVLARVLGGTNRTRFETLFGLDHTSLRDGGNRLLAADGEIGRLVVEAGGGLRALVDRVASLDIEIDALFTKHRSGARAFYKALDAVEAADSVVRSSIVTKDSYEEADLKRREAEETYERARTETRELAQRLAALDRMIRVVPSLRELQRLTEHLEGYSDLPMLPGDLEEQVKSARLAAVTSEGAKDNALRIHRDLKSRRDAIAVDERWPAIESLVDGVADMVVHVRKARTDRPRRLDDLSESTGRLANLRHLIGLDDAASIEERAPSAERLDIIGQLHTSGIERGPRLDAKRERAEELQGNVAALKARLEASQSKGHDKAFGASAADFAGLPIAAASLAAKSAELEGEGAAIEEAAKRLGLSSLADLRALDMPDPEAVQAQIDLRASILDDRDREAERADETEAAAHAAEEEIARLQQGGEVPTEAAIANVRSEREAALRPLRTAYLEDRVEGSADQRRQEVDALDRAIEHADHLVDRRSAEAQRVAALEQAERRLGEERAAHRLALRKQERLAESFRTEEEAFAALYPAALALRSELPHLKRLSQERAELIRRADAAAKESRAIKLQSAELEPRLQALGAAEAKAGLNPGADDQLADRVQSVMAAIVAHDGTHAEYLRDLKDHGEALADLGQVRKELERLEEEHRQWLEKWSEALTEIGVGPDASLAHAGLVIREWATAIGELTNLAQINRRLSRFDEDEAALAKLLGQLAEQLELSLPEDAVAASAVIAASWEANEQKRIERESLDPEVAGAEERLREAERTSQGAQEELARLRQMAAVADDEALAAIAVRQSEYEKAKAGAEQLQVTIAAAGDGKSVEELSAEWNDQDLDALKADRAEAAAEQRRVEEETRTAVEAMQTTRSAVEAFESAEGIGRALAERESAAAEMRNIVERWLELSMARELINRAITLVRTEQQDPLVRRAGELFAITTRGAFEGVGTDVDTKGNPVVVGRRANGSVATVSEMSDGTRDQLFLSFRLASIERYASAAEPLPFIADDILVHFDDERSAATLELLARFGETNQVLLFTHHGSVRDQAARLAKTLPVEVIELAA